MTTTRSSSISPTSRSSRPRVAAQAWPAVVRRPSTASATTRTSRPLSTTVANRPKKVPRYVAKVIAPVSNVAIPPEGWSSPRSRLSRPAAARARVTSTGTTMNPVVTSAASPTIARGLRRMVLKAPSKRSPSPRGRSGTTPGLCTGGA